MLLRHLGYEMISSPTQLSSSSVTLWVCLFPMNIWNLKHIPVRKMGKSTQKGGILDYLWYNQVWNFRWIYVPIIVIAREVIQYQYFSKLWLKFVPPFPKVHYGPKTKFSFSENNDFADNFQKKLKKFFVEKKKLQQLFFS